MIIPHEFYWEGLAQDHFKNGTRKQELKRLSTELNTAGIPHRLTGLVLEIKEY